MTGQLALVWTGMGATAGAVALLRFAWALPQRSALLTVIAWGLLLAGLVLSAGAQGAWGVALAILAAMGCAALLLAHAALTAANEVQERQMRVAQPDAKALYVGRRVVTFLITVPGALLAAVLVGLAARVLAVLAGWHEADANVATLFMMPIIWAVLDVLILMTPRRAVQGHILLAPALAGAAILLAGGTL